MATLNELIEDKMHIEDMLIESEGEITPEIAALMDVNESNIASKIDSYHSLMLAMDYGTESIDKEIKRLQTLKRVKQNSVKSLKARLLWLMKEADLRKIRGNLCEAYIKKNAPSVVVDDDVVMEWQKTVESSLDVPSYVKVTVSIDKTAAKEALGEGEISGMTIVQNETVVIK